MVCLVLQRGSANRLLLLLSTLSRENIYARCRFGKPVTNFVVIIVDFLKYTNCGK